MKHGGRWRIFMYVSRDVFILTGDDAPNQYSWLLDTMSYSLTYSL